MSYTGGGARRIEVEGTLPAGWRRAAIVAGSTQMLAIEGPKWVGDRRPRLVVAIEGDEGMPERAREHAPEGTTARGGQVRRSQRAVACRDRWPHRRWGSGILRQGVYVDDGVAMACDTYHFHDGRTGIRVELDCELSSLFAVEEDVARIVGALTSRRSR